MKRFAAALVLCSIAASGAHAACVESGSTVVLTGRIVSDPASTPSGPRAVRLRPDSPFCIKGEFEGRPRQRAALLVPAEGVAAIDDPDETWVRVSGRIDQVDGSGLMLRYRSVHRFR